MMSDLNKVIFSDVDTHKPIDIFRRNLQKAYVKDLTDLLSPGGGPSMSGGMTIMFGSAPADPSRTDVSSIARAQLTTLRNEMRGAAVATPGNMSCYHFTDLVQ